ncbi:MAG: acyl-[acyl-carrier-protein] thioesterase [Lachnospiraceae bacterium]|nr:acyl-[acyl-carrier-protein] thioesterase [Lachnospiraceae bacterium]
MYSFESRIRYSETDNTGHLSLGSLVDYFQDTSTFHAEDVGVGFSYLEPDHRAWIINAWQIEIEEMPILGEEVVVETWPNKFVKFIGNRNYVIKGKKDGKVYARANSIWALYDMEKGFPSVMTADEVAAYNIEEPLDMPEKPRKIRVEGDFESAGTLIIMRDRLDTNIHVNNAQYVKLACNYIPEDMKVAGVRVEYKVSMKLGDEIWVSTLKKDNYFYVKYTDKEGADYAIIEFESK